MGNCRPCQARSAKYVVTYPDGRTETVTGVGQAQILAAKTPGATYRPAT